MDNKLFIYFEILRKRNVHCQMVWIGSVVFEFNSRKFEAVNSLRSSFNATVLQEYEETFSQFIILLSKYGIFLVPSDEQWLVRRRKDICMLRKVDEGSS